MDAPTCFKAYDIRGRVPEELNGDLAWHIGHAFATELRARRVVVCRDVRPSGEALAAALTSGLHAAGCEVLDIGVGGTENLYFAVPHLAADGGIMVTASHNPADYNGMKPIGANCVPITATQWSRIAQRVAAGVAQAKARGAGNRQSQRTTFPSRSFSAPMYRTVDCLPQYLEHLLGYLRGVELPPLTIVSNAGHGGAGVVVDALAAHLPLRIVPLHHEPDGSFPLGVPNPLLPENREGTAHAVRNAGADLGLAWDGDFDRCFFFDHRGEYVEPCYLVGLLAAICLRDAPAPRRVVRDPRVVWSIDEAISAAGSDVIASRTGHAYIKARMREVDAVYGGEASGHHYFRSFHYCDSGMIPWLLLVAHLSRTGTTLRDLVAPMQARFPISGEINWIVRDIPRVLRVLEERYAGDVRHIDRLDGLSMEFDAWRFNVRASNTEPLLRVNAEARGDAALLRENVDRLLEQLRSCGEPT